MAGAWETVGVTTPMQTGAHVKDAQTLLSGTNAFHQGFGVGEIDGQAGPVFGNAVKRAKRALGYPSSQCGSNFGPVLHAYLTGARKLPATYVIRRKARALAARVSPEKAARKAAVSIAASMIAIAAQIHYAMTRPIDLSGPKIKAGTWDCSGSCTRIFKLAGMPDPNGNGWNGSGYTGTIMAKCKQISRRDAQPGDLLVYGAYPGEHVVMVMSGTPSSGFMLFSHGEEAGPLHISEATEAAAHAGQAQSWYSGWERN